MFKKIQPFRLLAWCCLFQAICSVGSGLYLFFFATDHLWDLLIPVVIIVVSSILSVLFFNLKPTLNRYRFFKFFFLIQIPYFDFNVISYKFGSILAIFFGFSKTFLENGGAKYSFVFDIGKLFWFKFYLYYSSFFSSFERNLLGINLFALIIFILMRRAQKNYTLALQAESDSLSQATIIDRMGRSL